MTEHQAKTLWRVGLLAGFTAFFLKDSALMHLFSITCLSVWAGYLLATRGKP